ncbi:MAG: hypothetical protein ACWA5L_09235 [bacterium]
MAYIAADSYSTTATPLSAHARRIIKYVVIGAIAAAFSLPMAIITANSSAGGLFDECYGQECAAPVTLARAP